MIRLLIGPPLVPQLVFAAAWLGGYLAWSLAYYRSMDPIVRAAVGRLVGARVVWVLREGSLYSSDLSFQLLQNTLTWGVEQPERRTPARDFAVLMLTLVVVRIAAGMAPIAVLLAAFLWLGIVGVGVGTPLLVAAVAIYSRFWSGVLSGAEAPPGMEVVRPPRPDGDGIVAGRY